MAAFLRSSRSSDATPVARPSRRPLGLSGTARAIGLGGIAAAGGLIIVSRGSTAPGGPTSGGNSASFGSIPPPKCPPCGLYREPNGAVYAVDGQGVYHWIEDELAFAQCGYNHANQHAIGYDGLTGCDPGPNVTDSCGTCPCAGPFGIVDWCTAVPCPGCL